MHTNPNARRVLNAKLLASLNHPNIAAIYGLEQSGNTDYLVMELVGGMTLADRIRRGAMSLEEALPIARQVAEAVEYEHDHNVIHRDLKPANIKVTEDGALAPDERRVAAVVIDSLAARYNLWLFDGVREEGARLTYQERPTRPLWALDGRRIYFTNGTAENSSKLSTIAIGAAAAAPFENPGPFILRMSPGMAGKSSSSQSKPPL